MNTIQTLPLCFFHINFNIIKTPEWYNKGQREGAYGKCERDDKFVPWKDSNAAAEEKNPTWTSPQIKDNIKTSLRRGSERIIRICVKPASVAGYCKHGSHKTSKDSCRSDEHLALFWGRTLLHVVRGSKKNYRKGVPFHAVKHTAGVEHSSTRS